MKLNKNKGNKSDPRMEKTLDRIERKIDKLADSHIELYQEQSRLAAQMEINTKDLAEHMRRTEALEQQVGFKYLLKIVGSVSVVVTAIIKFIGIVKL